MNVTAKTIITACILAAVLCIKAPVATAAEASNVFAPKGQYTTDASGSSANLDTYANTQSIMFADGASDAFTARPGKKPKAKANSTDLSENESNSTITTKKFSGLRQHFTWGIDLGASIDLSGEDLSTFDAETYFGYKGNWIRTAALGAGMHKAFGNKYTFIPVYALLRTSFRSKPSLLFFELKAGYSFNTLNDSGSFGGAYGSFGLGVNLAMSKSFQSHIVLAYSYYTLRHATDLDIPYSGDNINSAVLRFGVNF
ncbi:MAG: hypothetical protein NC217_02545 [Muribaculaceae bacterium]|nr:hypothetical protein [Muribaculaceae bacterium]